MSATTKYTLGSGVPTEGSLIDGILPHVEDPNARTYNAKDWPTRTARDESHLNRPERNRREGDDHRALNRRQEKKHDGHMDLRDAVMSGPEDYTNGLRADLDGVVDLTNTEDVDVDTRWAPGKCNLPLHGYEY